MNFTYIDFLFGFVYVNPISLVHQIDHPVHCFADDCLDLFRFPVKLFVKRPDFPVVRVHNFIVS